MPRGARVVLRLRRQFCFHPGRPAGAGKAARHQDIAPVRRNEPQYGKEALSPAIRSQDNRCHDPFLILAAEGTSRQPGEAAGDLFRRASRKITIDTRPRPGSNVSHDRHLPRPLSLLRKHRTLAASCAAAHDEVSARHQDLFTWSWRVRQTGGYLRDESPDRARGGQDVDVGITGVCGDRLPEHRAAAAAIQEQPLPEVGALG